MPQVTLPDGKTIEVPAGATVGEVAARIGPGLAKAAIAGKIDGDIVDLKRPITSDCRVEILKADAENPDSLYVLRHSCAHVMAEAICGLFHETRLAYGPPIENGFYYDIELARPITPEDFEAIEAKMAAIIKEDRPFTRYGMNRDEAMAKLRTEGNRYKIDNAERAEGEISFYITGADPGKNFEDLCRGPHLPSTGRIGAFKLMQVSGAYYRGDQSDQQLQRIYGTAWPTAKDQVKYLNQLEEAKKRDHRKLGTALDLFHLQEESPGAIFWHANGWAVYRRIVQYIRELTEANGYQEINTPQIVDRILWEKSGHWEKFHDSMFITETEAHTFAIKPMNCPCHIQVFKARTRSYRDLPLRLSEFGSCHRNEPSGTLHGIMRVRAFVQDDAHIFCTPEQVYSEVANFCELTQKTYRDFGFEEVVIKLATRPKVRLGSDEIWDRGDKALEDALNRLGVKWELNPGEGAFYGPKIEYNVKDCLGRMWQLGTIQIDYNMPERLGAKYVGEDNQPHTPVMLHRAICGSLERFIGILIEHLAGAFPLWLAPVQAIVVSVSEKSESYARSVYEQLREAGLRVTLDTTAEKIGPKKHNARKLQIPYILVVGEREAAEGTVNVNDRSGRTIGSEPLDVFVDRCQREIRERAAGPAVAASA